MQKHIVNDKDCKYQSEIIHNMNRVPGIAPSFVEIYESKNKKIIPIAANNKQKYEKMTGIFWAFTFSY